MGAFYQGLVLMVTGMASVLIFLIILVIIVKGLAVLSPKDVRPKVDLVPAANNDAVIALAIAAALRKAGR